MVAMSPQDHTRDGGFQQSLVRPSDIVSYRQTRAARSEMTAGNGRFSSDYRSPLADEHRDFGRPVMQRFDGDATLSGKPIKGGVEGRPAVAGLAPWEQPVGQVPTHSGGERRTLNAFAASMPDSKPDPTRLEPWEVSARSDSPMFSMMDSVGGKRNPGPAMRPQDAMTTKPQDAAQKPKASAVESASPRTPEADGKEETLSVSAIIAKLHQRRKQAEAKPANDAIVPSASKGASLTAQKPPHDPRQRPAMGM